MNAVLFQYIDGFFVVFYPENHIGLPFFPSNKSIGVFQIDFIVAEKLYNLIQAAGFIRNLYSQNRCDGENILRFL